MSLFEVWCKQCQETVTEPHQCSAPSFSELRGQIADLRVALAESERALAEAKTRLNEVSEAHNKRVDHVEQLETELRSSRAKYDLYREAAEHRVKVLRQALKAGTSLEVVDHAETLGLLRDERAAHAQTRAELDRVRTDLRLQISCFIAASDDLATAQARIAELEQQYDVLSAAFDARHAGELAAESALASARKLLERVQAWHAWPDPTEPGPEPGVCLLNAVDAWLSTTPAPAPSEPER